MEAFENFMTSAPLEWWLLYLAGPLVLGFIGALIGGARQRGTTSRATGG